jgi:hypothetical protein
MEKEGIDLPSSINLVVRKYSTVRADHSKYSTVRAHHSTYLASSSLAMKSFASFSSSSSSSLRNGKVEIVREEC